MSNKVMTKKALTDVSRVIVDSAGRRADAQKDHKDSKTTRTRM